MSDYDDDYYDGSDGVKRGEDGRPMLDFPSMDDNPKPKNIRRNYFDDDDEPKPVDIDDAGKPMLDFKEADGFDISDRSEENQQRAISELKREYGSNYESAVKNARSVLQWADSEYHESVGRTGLGNFPKLIIELNKLGKKLEVERREANQSGVMREASLKAFEKSAREKVNHLITKVEAEYISR